MSVRTSLIAFVVLLFSSATSDAKITSQFKSGVWKGAALASEESGKFSSCMIKATYKSGIDLIFAIDRTGNFTISLYHKDWRIDSAALGKISLSIDASDLGKFDVEKAGESQILARLGKGDRIFEQFRKGRRLRMVAPKETFHFVLQGTAKALKKSLDCVVRNLAGERRMADPFAATAKSKTDQNPFKRFDRSRSAERRVARRSQPSPIRSPAPTQGIGANTEGWKLFIKLAVGKNARLIPLDRGFRKLGVEQAWEASGVRGFVGRWKPDASIDQLTNLMMGALGSGCQNYATGSQSTEWIDDAEVKTAFGKC